MRRTVLVVSSLFLFACKSETDVPRAEDGASATDLKAADAAATPAAATTATPADATTTSSTDATPTGVAERIPGLALTTPEEALMVFADGTRTSDIDKLWAVMPKAARAALPEVIQRAGRATDDELAKVGLTRGELATIAPRDFFARVVKATPVDPTRFPSAPTEVKASYEEPGRTRASVRYKIGDKVCTASTLLEDGLWRVEQAGCDDP